MWTKSQAVGFVVDNAQEDDDFVWESLYIIYNGREETLNIVLPEGEWFILVDAESSLKWTTDQIMAEEISVEPHSVLILGSSA